MKQCGPSLDQQIRGRVAVQSQAGASNVEPGVIIATSCSLALPWSESSAETENIVTKQIISSSKRGAFILSDCP